MEEVRVETGVDDLIQFLKDHGKVSLKEIADAMKIEESFVQAWTDFLIEENIVGVEYKFTKPYLFLNDVTSAQSLQEEKKSEVKKKGLIVLKDEYFARAREKKLPDAKIQKLWTKKLDDALEKRKEYFIREAAKRKLSSPEGLFSQYKEMLERV
jgi:predicted ArsR family transcriptional regulator